MLRVFQDDVIMVEMKATDVQYLAKIIDNVIQIGTKIQIDYEPKTIKDFSQYFIMYNELIDIKENIASWMVKFPFYN